MDVGFHRFPRTRPPGGKTWCAVLCLLVGLLMADDALAVEEVHLPLPPPIQGALTAGPFNFQFTGEDHCRLTVFNSLAGVRVAVHYRTAPTTTTTQANSQTLPPTSDRVINTLEFDVGPGYLLNVVAFASSGAPKRGQTYVKLEVIRGFGSSAIVLGCVLGGYVTAHLPLAWPGSPIESSFDGDGYIRTITGTDPAAGAEFSELVPTGARWELLALAANLVTNATVADRRPGVVYEDSGNTYFRSPQTQTIPAGSSVLSHWSQSSAFNPSIRADVPIAELPKGAFLLAGQQIRSATNSLQAGDNYGAPLLVVREWLEV